MARNDHSSTNHREVNSKKGDLPSQDSIRRAMVAERQSIQEQRNILQAAYEARSRQQRDDIYWGSEGRKIYNQQREQDEEWLSWYDTRPWTPS